MIELVLAAERLVRAGDLDHAERLYLQVAEADPQNAIAVAGLARVALARGDRVAAGTLARRALDIDPEDVAAGRLIAALQAEPAAGDVGHPPAEPEVGAVIDAAPPVEPAPSVAEPAPPARASLLRRILGFFRR